VRYGLCRAAPAEAAASDLTMGEHPLAHRIGRRPAGEVIEIAAGA
jgi:hypothetical protein